jgi:hypothetical protein
MKMTDKTSTDGTMLKHVELLSVRSWLIDT